VQGRLFAQLFSERLGQFVVPENRAGADGQIGTNLVAEATGLGDNEAPAEAAKLCPALERIGRLRLHAGACRPAGDPLRQMGFVAPSI
jgi:tripartite-type tricarboxylate transporter receptor subunit TctC